MKRFLLLFVLLLFARLDAAPQATQVNLKKEVYLSKEKIYLNDIAEISAASSNEAVKIGAVYIRMAALPGYSVEITREMVINKLARDYPDAVINGGTVIVRTGKTTVLKDDLINTAINYVKANMPWNPDDVTITAKTGKLETGVLEGYVELKVNEEVKPSFKGACVIPVEIYVDGKFYKIEPVTLGIQVTSDCFLAARNMRKGEAVTPADVLRIRKDITNLPAGLVTDISGFDGKITKRAIIKGALIVNAMMERTALFRRGAAVKVVLQMKNIAIETSGTAESDGRAGEAARVKLNTGKVMDGTVDPGGAVIIQK